MHNILDLVSAGALEEEPGIDRGRAGKFRIKPSVRVFADFSRSKFFRPYDYLMMINEIRDTTPVFTYVLLEAAAALEFEHIVNIAACADRFHIVGSDEVNVPNYAPDVNVVISDASRELLFSKPIKEHLILEKKFFTYGGEKKDIKSLFAFLRRLLNDIYGN